MLTPDMYVDGTFQKKVKESEIYIYKISTLQ